MLPIIGWVVFAFFSGNLVADLAHEPKVPCQMTEDRTYPTEYGSLTLGGGIRLCRPRCYDKLAWKPWPFRKGRFYECDREGDKDHCTGEEFHGGKWVKMREPDPYPVIQECR